MYWLTMGRFGKVRVAGGRVELLEVTSLYNGTQEGKCSSGFAVP